MINRCAVLLAFLSLSIRAEAIGRPVDTPEAVRNLAQRAAPYAIVEYCGALGYRRADYYLFVLGQNNRAGLLLIRQQGGSDPVIVDADTSFFPFTDDQEPALDRPILDGVEVLLRKRNGAKEGHGPREYATPTREVSFVGEAIDRIVYPICGFRLESDSTRQILRRLRTGPATEVEPRTAPPGSIIVSPTRFFAFGPVYIGHAGIVGSDGSIHSADARLGGAWAKDVPVSGWLKEFAGNNGCYAFVLRAPAKAGAQNN